MKERIGVPRECDLPLGREFIGPKWIWKACYNFVEKFAKYWHFGNRQTVVEATYRAAAHMSNTPLEERSVSRLNLVAVADDPADPIEAKGINYPKKLLLG